MKKIMITTTLLLGTVFISAQKAETTRQVKEYTVSSEDPQNPLVNGIPYNKYKAQVQAEQIENAAKEADLKKKSKEESKNLQNSKANISTEVQNQKQKNLEVKK